MKIFAVLTICVLVGGSHAFLGELADVFKNIGHQLATVGTDLLHVAEPVANSLLTTLEKAGTQLLTTAATDLLSHLGAGAGTKRDLSAIVSKVQNFVAQGKVFLKEKAETLVAAFKATVAQIQSEIHQVLADAKPIQGLIDEVKSVISGHNNFVDSLINKAKEEAMTLFTDVEHLIHNKRDMSSFGDTLKNLLAQVAAPLKSAFSGIVQQLETQVASLLG